mgnify:CR=1 FL=1
MSSDRTSFVADLYRRAHAVSIHRMAAAMAFYALFALPPLVLVTMHVAVWILGPVAAEAEVEANMTALPEGFQTTVSEIIDSVQQPEPHLVFARFASYVVIAFAATAGFSHLQWMLNQIWRVPRRRKRQALLLWLLKRLVGFALVVASCLVLVGSASLGIALRTVPDHLLAMLPDSWAPYLSEALNDTGFFLVACFFFALVFWILPDAKVPWRSALLGAFASACLLIVGKHLLVLYLNQSWQSQAFGAAGSLVATLASMYVGAVVVLMGGVVSAVVTERRAASTPA